MAARPHSLLAALAVLLVWTAPARADLYITYSLDNIIEASIQHADCGFFTGHIALERPGALLVHPDGTRLYVASSAFGTVRVLSTLTRSVIAEIPVGGSPFGPTRMAIHPDGSRLYALSNNRVAVIDTASNTVIANVFTLGVANDIAVHPDGSRIYVSTAAGVVQVIGVASNVVLLTVPVGELAMGLALLPDGSYAYVAVRESDGSYAVKVLETSQNTLVSLPAYGEGWSIAAHPDGTRVYVTQHLSAGDTQIPGRLLVIDTATQTVTAELVTGRSPTSMAIDARHIYVANALDDTVSVFDNQTHAEVQLMQVGRLPSSVATYVPPPAASLAPDVEVTGIEVTQGIQDAANSVNLIAERRTFARVHVRSVSSSPLPIPKVSAALFGVLSDCAAVGGGGCNGIRLDPLQPVNSLVSGSTATTLTTLPVIPSPKRTVLNNSFLFELPWEWTKGKPLRLYAVVSQSGPPSACRLDAPMTQVNFDPRTVVRVQFVRAGYPLPNAAPGTPPVNVEVPDNELLESASWLRRAFPISTLSQGRDWAFVDNDLTSRVDQTHDECQDLLIPGPPLVDARNLCAQRYLRNLPALQDASASADGVYAFIPQHSAMPFTRGACCTGKVSAGPTDGMAWTSYAAHELGHLWGRHHPVGKNSCGHSATDANYPYPDALIRPSTSYDPQTGLLGFDGGDPQAKAVRQVLSPNAHDVMSYCSPKWISDYTYLGVYNRLRNLGSGASVQATGAPGPQMGDWLMVLGEIRPGATTPVYMQARRLDRVMSVPERPPGNHSIRLTNADGVTLAEYSFAPEEDADANAFSFAHVVPFAAGARQIQIVDNSGGSSQVIGTKPISPNAPTIGDVSFQGAPGPNSTSVTLQWNASDPDGDALKFDIFVLREAEESGLPILGSVSGTSAQIDTSTFGGSLRFRVVATDGVQSAFSDSPTLNLAIKPPAPRIVMPGPETTIVEGQIVNFEGMAMDPQDGELPESGLSWSVGDSEPTAGSKFTVSGLPAGTHEVVLTATNSLGVSATATARVIVKPDEPLQSPMMSVSPVEIAWHIAPGEQEIQTASVTIENVGPGVLGFTASTDAPWLLIDEQSGTAPSTLTVTVDPAGLEDGVTRQGALTIAATADPEQTVTIPVTLSVGNTLAVGRPATPDPEEPPPTCAADVTSTISITRAAPRLNRVTGRYVQQVTLQNIGSSDITGPISLVLDTLSSNATLANSTGQTECALPAAPYVNVNAGTDNLLSAGESAGIVLEFANPANQPISYGTRVLAGSEAR